MDYIDIEREDNTLELRDFNRVIRKHWRAITLITLLCTLVALVFSLLMPKTYSSTATGLITPTGKRDLNSAWAGENLAQSKAVSYESLATSRPVAETVNDELSLGAAPDALIGRISTAVPNDTAEIRITADADTPNEAADLANAWVVAFADQVSTVETASNDPETTGGVTVQPLSNAPLPQAPSSPNLKLNLALGLVGGLVLGLSYAIFRYKTDRGINSAEQIRDEFDLTVLGTIPTDEGLKGNQSIVETIFSGGHGSHAFTEALRMVRTNLSFVSVDNPPRTIVVTSPRSGEGKSSITANLAVAIASTGRNIVVVDGDLRLPVMAQMFGVVPGVGVTDVLSGRLAIDEALQTYDRLPNLQVLGAGQSTPNPAELLSSKAMHTMLETLAEDALVLVDAPPLLPVTDAALLTASADGAIIVAMVETTTTDDLDKAVQNLRQVRGNVLGVVLNRVPADDMDAGYYGKTRRTAHDSSLSAAGSGTGKINGWR